ncbi:uncharacterized protein LOC108904337 [Anoplophora glabripennis]|uniref:uncharacterized protein LOC108904337 n=1 Tax=Anoplophora glabripennis TaxID=217634 RepID=UPI000873ABF4|nr:uncharacterized protein LOC108904337 [Anoplophora glabripennis]
MENTNGAISRDTLANLKCSICDNFLTVPPILITSLYGNQYKCGRCYFVETEVNIPATMFETLASTMRFPCIHPSCEREIPWNTIKSHEETCIHQPMKCPCGEILEIHEAHRHFVENHPDIISEESVIVENPGFSQFHTRLIVKNDVPFLVYVLCERKADIKVGIYSLQDTIKKYEFRLEISTNSNMSKITIPNKKITKFNTREHCSDCLLRTCRITYHKYQNGANNPVSEMTSARVNTSSVFKVLNCDDFILLITVIERGNRAYLEANFTRNEQIRKSWECQICQEYLAPPIFLCPTGHSLCGSCKMKMAVCPYCILDIGESRNFTLEEMAEHVQLACTYETMGCRFLGNVEKLARHEAKCENSRAEPSRKKSRLDMSE